ncbi:MAG: right-handed parallel beta-helix repeat-containing protein [Puniceicoccaceae bacterium]
MNKLHILVLLFVPVVVQADQFHVAKAGSDNNPGTADEPFLTIQKAADTMAPGDITLIHEGTYRESIRPAQGDVVFKAAPGESVIVSGYEPVTDWSVHDGAIYVAQLSWDLGDENQLVYNNQLMNLARWPNKTNFDPFDLEAVWASGTSSYVAYPGIPDGNWGDGGVIWFLGKSRWTSWRRPITSTTGNRVNFETLPGDWDYGGSHNPANGGEFFIMNILEALDSNGEWYIDRSARRIYFQAPDGEDPSTGNALVRRRTTAFDLSTRIGVIIDGLTIRGANVDLRNARECVIKNSRILYGNHTISSTRAATTPEASIVMNDGSRDNLILRNEIQWGAASGIILKGTGNRVDNNHIGNFDYLGCYACPVELRGTNDLTRNHIFNGGRDLIRGGGNGSNCGYNDLHHSNLINDDCGAIYTCCSDFGYTRFHHNWIHDITSRNEHYSSYKATGIYLDNTSQRVIVDHNVIWNMEWACIQINWAGEDLLIYNNTLWSNSAPTSKSMGRWVNNTVMQNVPLYNNLMNEDELVFTDESNNCILELDADPFEGFANQNFVPLDGSCAIDSGMIIPDYAEEYIGSAPDIGAYERGADVWVPGPDWSIGETLADEMYTPEIDVTQTGPSSRIINLGNLSPFAEYGLERFTGGDDWETLLRFEQDFTDALEFDESQSADISALYRVREIYEPEKEPVSPGLVTFDQFVGLAHDTYVPTGTEINGPDGLTITVGGDSDGFGVVGNPILPVDVLAPALYVRGDGTGSSFVFSTAVEVASLWVSAPSWALNNDPQGTQRITGKLNGEVIWTFTNTNASTEYFKVTAGAGEQIDELVIYPKWVGVDNILIN